MSSKTNNVSKATSTNSNAGSYNNVLGSWIRQLQAVNIYWDMENCPVPHGVEPDNIAVNIRNVLREHPKINGAVKMFSAYGDFNKFPQRVRKSFHETGVRLIDVPSDRKYSIDNAIIVDMFGSMPNNPPLAYIMLISGNINFTLPLHRLDQLGYRIILAVPTIVGVSSAFWKVGKFVWDWPSLARGENSMPPVTSILHYSNVRGPQCPRKLVKLQYDEKSVQPSGIEDLKDQLVTLVELSGGSLPVGRLSSKYYKRFKEQLCLAKYGKHKLVDLLQTMSDVMTVEGVGRWKFIRLHNKQGPTFPRNDEKGKGDLDDNIAECGDATHSLDDVLLGKGREKSIHLHNKQGPTLLRNDKEGKGVVDDNIIECSDVAYVLDDFVLV